MLRNNNITLFLKRTIIKKIKRKKELKCIVRSDKNSNMTGSQQILNHFLSPCAVFLNNYIQNYSKYI